MTRGFRTWLIIALVLVLDVVTIVVPLFSAPWRWVTIVVLTGIALLLAGLRWLDRQQQRRREQDAYAALARQRQRA